MVKVMSKGQETRSRVKELTVVSNIARGSDVRTLKTRSGEKL